MLLRNFTMVINCILRNQSVVFFSFNLTIAHFVSTVLFLFKYTFSIHIRFEKIKKKQFTGITYSSTPPLLFKKIEISVLYLQTIDLFIRLTFLFNLKYFLDLVRSVK